MTYKTEAPDAQTTYTDIQIMYGMKSLFTLHKHPKQTTQGFDFNMNLFAYGGK